MKSHLTSSFRWLGAFAAVALLTNCGVPKEDYEALQKENQELQKVIDKGNASFRQLQLQLVAAQQELAAIPAIQKRIKDLEIELADKDEDLRVLEETFEKFRKDRRNAMMGKPIPSIRLDSGKTLRNAVITAFNDDELSIRHDDGFIKVALADSS